VVLYAAFFESGPCEAPLLGSKLNAVSPRSLPQMWQAIPA